MILIYHYFWNMLSLAIEFAFRRFCFYFIVCSFNIWKYHSFAFCLLFLLLGTQSKCYFFKNNLFFLNLLLRFSVSLDFCSFTKMSLSIGLISFILFGVYWASCCCRFIFLNMFLKILIHFFLKILPQFHSFSLIFGKYQIFYCCTIERCIFSFTKCW